MGRPPNVTVKKKTIFTSYRITFLYYASPLLLILFYSTTDIRYGRFSHTEEFHDTKGH